MRKPLQQACINQKGPEHYEYWHADIRNTLSKVENLKCLWNSIQTYNMYLDEKV